MPYVALLLGLAVGLSAYAQETERQVDIEGVSVIARRPLKSIGIVGTQLDSLALKENIALSMSDVLGFNSPVFVKSYGRATLSTVSFRGTGASHTQVTWNGMRMGNPMLGMTDFSTIPSYFVDNASLRYGSSAAGESSGALGGVVKLSTEPARADGFGMQFVQGVGMYKTFDEFLRLQWGNERWQTSTRVLFQSSKNDFRYRNRDKKENIYDDDMNIVGSYYPVERNRSGAFRDLHLLQELYYNTGRGDRFGLNAWYTASNRELPLLTTDYSASTRFDNRQREQSLRAVLSWEHLRREWKVGARAGYTYMWSAYDYRRDPGNGVMQSMTASRSRVNTLFGQVDGEYALGEKWLFSADMALYQHFVESRDNSLSLQEDGDAVVGYRQARAELTLSGTARWRPLERLGMAATMRGEMFGTRWAAVPSFMADWLLSRRGEVMLNASVARSHRFPTLNDLYFMPGGNPDLRDERGVQYELGASFAVGDRKVWSLRGSAVWYDQYVNDWIMWLPTTKGFFSPRNVRRVHAYGVELQANGEVRFAKEWRLSLSGTFSWAPSINEGDPVSSADRSVGKQLPYEPLISATVAGRLAWHGWALSYQWCHYSERYTMSSNDISLSGRLVPYYMSNISLEKGFTFRWADLDVKACVNNLFDEEYLSVLSRPMPGIHCEFFIGITPKWKRR